MNFVAIDFETAVKHHVCAVGIVTVEAGVVVEKFSTLIQPPGNEYNWYCMQVHGITPAETEGAQAFIHVYPEIKKRLQHRLVVAHNEAFDRSVLQKSMLDNGLDYAELNLADAWECTMRYCRASGKYPSGKSDDCCAVEGIELNHHEALSDAHACAHLYMRVRLNWC